MNIKNLKELIADLPDEMKVLIPIEPTEGFTGAFFSPCEEDSQVTELGTEDLDDEEIKEYELLNKPVGEKSLVLVPCGFYENTGNHTHEMN